MALQEAAEAYLVSLFEDTNLAGAFALGSVLFPVPNILSSYSRQACYYSTKRPGVGEETSWRTVLDIPSLSVLFCQSRLYPVSL